MLTWTMHKISVFERGVMAFREHSAEAGTLLQEHQGQHKLHTQFHWARAMDIMSDCFMISMLLYTGVIIQVGMMQSVTIVFITLQNQREHHISQMTMNHMHSLFNWTAANVIKDGTLCLQM